jgi:hypothetical protein
MTTIRRALATSPGLGWSNPDHPGHTLFPLLAMLLSNGTIGDALVAELEATGRDPLESFAMMSEEHEPKLTTPPMVALIQRPQHRADRAGPRRRHRRHAPRGREASGWDPIEPRSSGAWRASNVCS